MAEPSFPAWPQGPPPPSARKMSRHQVLKERATFLTFDAGRAHQALHRHTVNNVIITDGSFNTTRCAPIAKVSGKYELRHAASHLSRIAKVIVS